MHSETSTSRQRPRGVRGERKNIYFSHRTLQRLNRLTLDQGEQGFSATIDKALALLEREHNDYLLRIRDVIQTLAALPDMDEREQAILELTSLLNNELAARAIAQSLVEVVVLGPTPFDPHKPFPKEREE